MREELIGRFGKLARRWKGDEAGYVAKHSWIVKHWGSAYHCETCNTKSARRFEWANISGKYKRIRSDWKQLCPSCHRKYDKGEMCKHGHLFTPDNTYSPPKHPTWRNCKACQLTRNRTYATNDKV